MPIAVLGSLGFVAVFCLLFPSPGWWHLALKHLYLCHGREQPTRSPFIAVMFSGCLKHLPFDRVPINTWALWFPGGASCRWLVCFTGLLPVLSPASLLLCTGSMFYEKVQGLDLILFGFGPYPIGTSSMAQQLPINAHHFMHKCNIIYQQDYELHSSMFFRAQTYPPWCSQKRDQTH